MYDVEYNNIRASELKLLVKKRPDMPSPKLNYTETEVPGRDGMLLETDESFQDIIIPVEFNYGAVYWHSVFRKTKQWLFSKGNGHLRFMDDAAFYYKVKKVEIEDNKRLSLRVGNFIASFVCEPFQYLLDGDRAYGLDEVFYNPYYISHPTYVIKGEGQCELRVNGHIMIVDVGQEVTIDTDRMITYKNDLLLNTSVIGDYQDLYLISGENQIGITDGFEVAVIPHWRCL